MKKKCLFQTNAAISKNHFEQMSSLVGNIQTTIWSSWRPMQMGRSPTRLETGLVGGLRIMIWSNWQPSQMIGPLLYI